MGQTMKFELESGSRINAPKPILKQPVQNLYEEPKDIGVLGRLGVAGARGLEAPGRFVDTILELLGEPKLAKGSIEEDLARYLGATSPEQLEAQSLLESYAQRFLGSAPTAALFGPGAIASTALGSGTAIGLKALGAPEAIQDVGDLITQLGLGAAQGKFLTPGKAQKKAYDLATASVPEGLKTSARPIIDTMKNVEQSLATEVDKSIVEKINGIMETIDKNIFKKTINPNTAKNLRTSINQFRNKLPEDARHYADALKNGINDFFTVYGAENPTFYKHLSTADKLTAMRNMESYIGNFIEKSLLDKFGIKGIWDDILRVPFKIGSKLTLEPAEKFARNMVGNEAARDYVFNLVKPAIQQNPSLFLKNLSNLRDVLVGQEEFGIIPEVSKPSAKYEILRGKRR